MAELQDKLDSFILSATEVAELTGWPDAMVEEWLNVLRNILQITTFVEESESAGVEPDQIAIKNDAMISKLHSRLNMFKMFYVVPVISDTIASDRQQLICKNTTSIVVMLDTNAIKDDEVHIKRRGAKIRVMGDIDGETYKDINVLNYSMHLVFDGTDWSEI